MAGLLQDDFELTKLQLDVPDFTYECENLVRSVTHNGVNFKKNNTTVEEERTDTNTTILQDYGRLHLSFDVDPKATNVALYAQSQIDGKKAGEKPTGSMQFHDSGGDVTSTYDIERYHLESFTIGPFNAKSSANMVQSCTLDFEKFVRKS